MLNQPYPWISQLAKRCNVDLGVMHLSIFCPPGPVFYNGAFDAPSRLKGGDLDKK